MGKKKWSRAEKLALIAVIVTVLQTTLTLTTVILMVI